MENKTAGLQVQDKDQRLAELLKDIARTTSIFSEVSNMIFTIHEFPTFEHIFVSRAFTELTGIDQADIERSGGQIYYETIHPKDIDLLRAVYEKSYELFNREKRKNAAGFVFTTNFRIRTVHGNYLQVDNYSWPVLRDESGSPKIGLNIMRPAHKKGVNRFVVHYTESNLQLFYSRKLGSFVSEQRVELKKIEIQILKLSSEGVSERLISRKLGIKQSLVNHYKRSIFHKLYVNTMSEAVYTALLSGLI
jgi:DNA-binding CsgD family transcriptional regulator